MLPPGRGRWRALAGMLVVLLAVGSCDAYDLFDRPNGPLAGWTTSGRALVWRTDGLSPAWTVNANSAGFAAAGSPSKARRAFVRHGAVDAAVEWSWGTGGFPGLWVSGLLHTDPAGPITTGIRVVWWSGAFHLIEGTDTLATSVPIPAPTTGDTGRLEAVGTEARFIHNGLSAIDWVPWSGESTGEHGLFALDDGTGASLAKFAYVSFDTLAPDDRPHHLPVGFDVTGATDQTTALDAFVDGVPDGATVLLPRRAVIWSQRLVLSHRSDLVIDGNGSTIWQKRMPQDADGDGVEYVPVISLVSGRDLTLRNLTVRGAFPDGGVGMGGTAEGLAPGPYFGTDRVGSHGIRVEGVVGLTIADVDVREIFGDGIYLGNWRDPDHPFGSPDGRVPPSGVDIVGGSVRRNGRQGITVVSGTDVAIRGRGPSERYLLDGIAHSAIDLEPAALWDRVDGVTLNHIEIGGVSHNPLAAEGAAPPRGIGEPLDYSGQDEIPDYVPDHLDTKEEYVDDPRGFRRINNVSLYDWHLPDRPFSAAVGVRQATEDGMRITSRRHGWSFVGIRSWKDDGDRDNPAGAQAILWQVDDVHFDEIRARLGPYLPMHFASVASGDGTPASGLTIGPGMDLGGTDISGLPYPPAFVGDVRYNGVTVNGPFPP